MQSVPQKGRHLTNNSSEESKWLSLVLNSNYNNGGLLASILTALGGSPTPQYQSQYDLLSADTLSLDVTDKYKAISFQVISGTVDVTINSTTVTYPAGSNINFTSVSYLGYTVDFLVGGIASDGLNEVLVQAVK